MAMATAAAAEHCCGLFSAVISPSTCKISTANSNSTMRMRVLIGRRRRASGSVGTVKMNLITEPEYFEVGRLIGSYGFMNITSYCSGLQSSFRSPEYYSLDQKQKDEDDDTAILGSLKLLDVGEGNVKIRLYEGRLVQGPQRGTPVIFKVYPGQQVGGIEADAMAANELSAHASLQKNGPLCKNIQLLLGGFETKTGEQWLAFRNHGVYTAADYARVASKKMSKVFWNPFEKDATLQRKRHFVTRLLQGAMQALSYMHEHDRLHQSLGPYSVVLNTMAEEEVVYLIPRLRDLAFSVDIRYPKPQDDLISEGLWRRASTSGAFTPLEKRNFGIADDIYEAGLLFAYLAFVPFCEPGIMDSLSLRRLLENTFQLDLETTREYCLADDRLSEAVNFLDHSNKAGWELLQAMLNQDFGKRPTAEAVLKHHFFQDSNF